MKHILQTLLFFLLPLMGLTQATHDQMSVINVSSVPGYDSPPNYLQNSTTTTGPDSDIGPNEAIDIFINYDFDTTNTKTYVVYTTDGSAPTKTNGTVVEATFSTYEDPSRLWVAQIPGQPAGTVISYVIYSNTNNGDLPSANQRLSPNGFEGSWDEGDSFYELPTILALKLISFDVAKNDAGNPSLIWKTAGDCQFSFIQVERSLNNGSIFEPLTKISKNEFLNGCIGGIFTYTDSQISKASLVSKANYRLKIVEEDNSIFEYSNLVSTDIKTDTFVYYNASNQQLQIENINKPTDLKVLNSNGQVFADQMINQNITLGLNQLTSGLHFVILDQGDNRLVTKFIVP